MKKIFVVLVVVMAVTAGIFAQSGDLPRVAIQPVNMNVLYIGVDNPLVIAVPGVPAEKVTATISQGTLVKVSGSEYTARPAQTGEARISVHYEVDGQEVVSSMNFGVRLIPNPMAVVGGRAGGFINKEDFLAQSGVAADMGAFLFNLRFRVTSFNVEVETTDGGIRAEGSGSSTFTDAQRTLISGLNRGQKVFITNIKAMGNHDGRVVNLRDIVFTIN